MNTKNRKSHRLLVLSTWSSIVSAALGLACLPTVLDQLDPDTSKTVTVSTAQQIVAIASIAFMVISFCLLWTSGRAFATGSEDTDA